MSATHRRLSLARLPGVLLTGHAFELPLDARRPDGEQLTVFAREAVSPEKRSDELPWLVFLTGGPGFPAPRPIDASGWLGRLLKDYRVLLLDQRGTGQSTPVTMESLDARGTATAQAEYLTHFRADAIVRDCEAIRRELVGESLRWAVLGQSFGGFCATHYLSEYPAALSEVLITGGLPPLEASVDAVYRRTYSLCARKNREFYARYPADEERVRRVAARIEEHAPELPGGDRLSARRFRQLGIRFGFKDGYGQVHYLLEEAEEGGDDGPLPYSFLKHLVALQAFDTNPLYSLLHEACWARGGPTAWAAERVRSEFPEFGDAPGGPLFFTGEMIYPWMFADYGRLAPLAEAAEILAQKSDWPSLYDPVQLARNDVPMAAAIYHDDMYVDHVLSRETADAIGGSRVWITNEHEHCGLRAGGPAVIGRLLDMARGLE